MRSEFSSLLSHLHRSFDSPPRGATEAGVVSVLYPFSYYMYTCILRCVVDLHYVCICMLYVYICDHVHSNVSTALMVSKHICALVRERMIQDVCAWIFGGGCHGEIISDPFCVCVFGLVASFVQVMVWMIYCDLNPINRSRFLH